MDELSRVGAFLRRRPVAIAGGAIGLALVLAGVAYAVLRRDLPPVEEFARDPLPLSTQVYARDGTTLLFEFAEERREPARLDEVPQALIDATIAAEDKSFWTNPGVDFGGIVRAAWHNLTGNDGERPQGASTITQQLVKQRLVGTELTLTRKMKEAILALEVTRHYSKNQILELYLNQIYYGNRAHGVKAAARGYFGTSDLQQLTLAQAALLAGLPQAPSLLDPSKPENVERAKARRSYVLAQMVETGAIGEEERRRAEAEPIEVQAAPPTEIRAPHFVFQVKEALAALVGGESQVLRGGFRVVTTLDWPKQEEAERQVRRWVEQLHDRNVWNAALVSIDPRTGEVLAYVGSVDYLDTDPKVQGQFDVAGLGERQAGSAFKVFTYLTALRRGATPATVVVDARTDFGGGYRPENADLQYHGPVTMRQALRESRNVPAVKFLQQYAGIEETVATARALGLTADFEKANAGLSLTLGSVPVKLVEMTGASGALANMGERVETRFILEVRDPGGSVVPLGESRTERALSPEVAWLMTDILKDTTNPARSFMFGPWTNIGRPAALKTGTTDDLKDVYSVGYTPQLVTGVWMGNSDGTPMSARDFSSAMGPGQLWRDYMKAVLAGAPVEDWPRPPGIVSANVAVAPGALGGYGSGLLPSRLSPWSTTELFVRGTVPTRTDDWFEEGCVGSPSGESERRAVMVIKEQGPDGWRSDRERWIREASAGRHDYGRFPWSSMLGSGGACPSPSPTPSESPSESPSPSPSDTPEPSPSPTPQPTPSPSPSPAVTPTPSPAATGS